MYKRFLLHVRRSWLIGASAFLLICNGSVVWLVEYASGGLQEEYSTADEMRQSTRSLLIGLLNAETGVRGFVITGDELYLGPYRMGTGSISDQLRILQLLPLDKIQHGEVAQLTSLLNKQLDELAGLLEIRRSGGLDAAQQRTETGADKVGLDILRSFTDRMIGDLSESMVRLQRRSKNYQVIATYCVLFGAFWLYVIILLAAPQYHEGGSLPWYGSGERQKRSPKE